MGFPLIPKLSTWKVNFWVWCEKYWDPRWHSCRQVTWLNYILRVLLFSRVHFVAQPANQYIVPLHIAILRYFTHIPVGGSEGKQTAGTLVYIEVTAMMYGLRMRSLPDSNPQTF